MDACTGSLIDQSADFGRALSKPCYLPALECLCCVVCGVRARARAPRHAHALSFLPCGCVRHVLLFRIIGVVRRSKRIALPNDMLSCMHNNALWVAARPVAITVTMFSLAKPAFSNKRCEGTVACHNACSSAHTHSPVHPPSLGPRIAHLMAGGTKPLGHRRPYAERQRAITTTIAAAAAAVVPVASQASQHLQPSVILDERVCGAKVCHEGHAGLLCGLEACKGNHVATAAGTNGGGVSSPGAADMWTRCYSVLCKLHTCPQPRAVGLLPLSIAASKAQSAQLDLVGECGRVSRGTAVLSLPRPTHQ